VQNSHQSGWAFIEPAPAQQVVDTVDRNPFGRCFCNTDRLRDAQVYVARLLQQNKNSTPYLPPAFTVGMGLHRRARRRSHGVLSEGE